MAGSSSPTGCTDFRMLRQARPMAKMGAVSEVGKLFVTGGTIDPLMELPP